MVNTNELPFKLSRESLAGWLTVLERLPPARAATQLSQVLKQLKLQGLDPGLMLDLLNDMIPSTLQLAKALYTSLSSEGKEQEKLNKVGKLSMQLPRQLGLLFCQLAESDKLGSNDLQTAVYHALQLIGHCMFFYARQYESPSATLWKKSALLFKQALYGDFHKSTQASKSALFSPQASIENVIQRNILFSLMNPTTFERDEIEGIFELAAQLAPRLELFSPREFNQNGFCWDLTSDQPPAALKHVKNQLTSDQLAISCRNIGNALQLGEINVELSRMTQAKLALFLTGYDQIFSSIIPGLPSRSELVAGLKDITHYLMEQSKLARIQNLSAQLAGPHVLKRDMSLVPLEHQRNVFESANHPFMQKPHGLGKPVFVLRTPNQNYLVIDGMAFDCITGDLVILYKEQHPNVLLIVRQQRQHDISGSTHILLEKISAQFEQYGYNSETGVRYLLLSGEAGKSPEIFLGSEKLSIGKSIELLDGRKLLLTACLESNDLFSRFRISFDS